jgi:hypothetical protein
VGGVHEVSGFIVVLGEDNQPVSVPEPCVYDWNLEPGWHCFRVRSRHRLTIERYAPNATLAVVDELGRILWASVILAGNLSEGTELLIEDLPLDDTVRPGEQKPHAAEWPHGTSLRLSYD